MKVPSVSFFLFLFLLSPLRETRADEMKNDRVYIVYMGAATSSEGSYRYDHAQILSSVLKRKENALVHSYRHGFSGFAAHLTEEEVRSIAQKPGVVSVFEDPVLQLHTTRSWDFLHYQTDLETDSKPGSDGDSQSSGQADTIIGILDTGIWPESESFSDKTMGPVPSRWRGTCMESNDVDSFKCNRKLIGARYYNDSDASSAVPHTARDMIGHGTHVASTAAGNSLPDVSYYGLASGTAKGGSPGSRIAMYRVCTFFGCRGSSILAAFDDAISDGVDVLSLSLGSSAVFELEFSTDPIAIGAYHAVAKGITVVCSAGNDGPSPRTVVNIAPWILTVGATTIDRDFESDVVLGGNKVIKGGGINFANIKKSPAYPLIYGSLAKSNSSKVDDARNCKPNSLGEDKIKGRIVLCDNDDGEYTQTEKLEEVKRLGGVGLILIDDEIRAVSSRYGAFPLTVITSKDASEILSYINSTTNPVATILATVSVEQYKPAPAVAYFSSRGPSYATKNLLKPDIAAPGVNILAAWIGNDTAEAPAGKEPPLFNLLSGTSMACPHVSGIAATVKSQNPSWSPSAVRSAIMTTATEKNNLKAPMTTHSGSVATPYDYGAGEVSPSGPLQPGLVYETETADYLQFLCNYGYDISKIKLISPTLPDGFTCPKSANADLISNMNYPSIAISKFNGNESKKVSRTVTNVGTDDETQYTVSVSAAAGVDVKVIPDTLKFTKNSKKLSYQVIFSSNGSSSVKGAVFGSITWTNGKHKVRSPFVVSSD
ncbi:hypothetical protein PVL29_024149 [Vitis rotundifolia]|uniref:CO(2)-response secreted protease n=2 Tax=Vitis rotundifolia TaxID=103349 RepID=A0AA38YR15_VITRO|nr:hypothetical protein PVL29_024149 [Vitis rotundifolia]